MPSINATSAYKTTSQAALASAKTAKASPAASLLHVENSQVTLSDEGKALLKTLQKIAANEEQKGKNTTDNSASTEDTSQENPDKSLGDHLESFAYGALGMESPDQLEQKSDMPYSVGQYLSAAATVGGLILAFA